YRRPGPTLPCGRTGKKERRTALKSYELSAEEVLQQQNSTPEGLSAQEAAKRLSQYGPNKLKEAEKATLLERFLDQLKDPMLILLLCAAAVSAVTSVISGESMTE